MNREEYQAWLAQVDTELSSKWGIGVNDIPEPKRFLIHFPTKFHQGRTAQDVVEELTTEELGIIE